jgi:small GTP-binding protein
MSIISKKICIIGESEVGKNSLICRFVERQFSDEYLCTVGVKISRKTLEVPGSKLQGKLYLQLIIWDVTGNPKFKAIAPSYLRGSCGAVVVADITRSETIEGIPKYIKLFLSVNPKGFIIIALNKSDLIDEEKLQKLVKLKELEAVAAIYPTSAKTGLYVDEIFKKIAGKIIESCTIPLSPSKLLLSGEATLTHPCKEGAEGG